MGRQYDRVFITLNQDKLGYGFKGREPSGRLLLEIKGDSTKISLIVQDLRPQNLYKAYLISCKESSNKGVLLGSVCPDPNGKYELKTTVVSSDVCGSKLPIEEFNAVAIVIISDGDASYPLVGYKSEPVRFKNSFMDSINKKNPPVYQFPKDQIPEKQVPIKQVPVEQVPVEQVPVEQIPEEQIPEELIPEEQAPEEQVPEEQIPEELIPEEQVPEELIPEETIINEQAFDDQEENQPLDEPLDLAGKEQPDDELEKELREDLHEAFKTMAQKFNEKMAELESYAFDKNGGVNKAAAPESVMQNETKSTTQSVITEDLKAAGDMGFLNYNGQISRLFMNNAPIKPFKRQSKDVHWIRIRLRELVLLNIDFWKYMNSPFIVSAVKINRHLILGLHKTTEKTEYYLGVPDCYNSDSKAKAYSLGFNQFKCCEDRTVAEGEYGYWLMPIIM